MKFHDILAIMQWMGEGTHSPMFAAIYPSVLRVLNLHVVLADRKFTTFKAAIRKPVVSGSIYEIGA